MDRISLEAMKCLPYERCPERLDQLLPQPTGSTARPAALGSGLRINGNFSLSKAVRLMEDAKALVWDPEMRGRNGHATGGWRYHTHLADGPCRCLKLAISWAASAATGSQHSRLQYELHLKDLLRRDGTTALQRDAVLSESDRLLEVSYR